MEKRKKRVVGLCVVLSVVLVIVVLASTLFNLKSVRVEFKHIPCELAELSENAVVESGKFKFGSSLLFTSVDEYAQDIEKSIGYIQVLKIERIFPNSYAVHIDERVPCVLVKSGELTYVLDRNLKILKVSNTAGLSTGTATYEAERPVLHLAGLDVANLQMGDFIENDTLKEVLKATHNAIFSIGKEITTAILSNITLSLSETSELTVKMVVRAEYGGGEIEVDGTKNLSSKMLKAFTALKDVWATGDNSFQKIRVTAGEQTTVQR